MSTILGIDLGTSNSCLAVLDCGHPLVIPNQEGARTTPSTVAFSDNNEILVGQVAKRQAILNPRNTIYSATRLLGRHFESPELKGARERFPYQLVKAPHGGTWIKIQDGVRSPPQVLALVLHKLKAAAEDHIGDPVEEAILTVPSYFNYSQRQATKVAGANAGLNVQRILNTSTAAALGYGFTSRKTGRVAVYDLGGGNFNVSILEIKGGFCRVLSTVGDTWLGGDDFDQLVINWLIEDFRAKTAVDQWLDPLALYHLKEAAEKAKVELSALTQTEIVLPFISAGQSSPKHFSAVLTHSRFEQMVEPLLAKTVRYCQQALDDAGLRAQDIDDAILVGGQTRIPAVIETVRGIFGREPNRSLDPDEIVAIGAAVQTGTDLALLEVTPHTLGIETRNGTFTPVIERNRNIPTKTSRIFTTVTDNQPKVEVHVLEGENDRAEFNTSLGRFQCSDIEPAPMGVPQIEVSFEIDINGIVDVTAVNMTPGRQQGLELRGNAPFAQEEMERFLREANGLDEEERARRKRNLVRGQLRELLDITRNHFEFVSSKLTEPERARIRENLEASERALEGSLDELNSALASWEKTFKALVRVLKSSDFPTSRSVVGIDLGTTRSRIAVMGKNGPQIIPDHEGNRFTPSIVALTDQGDFLVGEEARYRAANSPKSAVFGITRLVGLRFGSQEAEALREISSCEMVEAEDGYVHVKIQDKTFSAALLLAQLLRKLRTDAETHLNQQVESAVVTVPAHYDEVQCGVVREAAEIARLSLESILNHPTAAAMSCGSTDISDKRIAVFDLGGSASGVTILQFERGMYKVLSSRRQASLGGENIDQMFVDWLVEDFESETDIDLKKHPVALQRLKEAAEKAKCELSDSAQSEIVLPSITGDRQLNVIFTRARLEQYIEPLLKKIWHLYARALKDARLGKKAIDEIVLAGGQCRNPLFTEFLEREFGKPLMRPSAPDEVVALGASLAAAGQAGDKGSMGPLAVNGVTANTVGIETRDGTFTPIILRNAKLPATASRVFTTVMNGQEAVEVHVLRGESPLAACNRSIGRFRLTDLPQAPRGAPEITVSFQINEKGAVRVGASEATSGHRREMMLQTSPPEREREVREPQFLVPEKEGFIHRWISRLERLLGKFGQHE